jgi:sensor histidine kinase YesM
LVFLRYIGFFLLLWAPCTSIAQQPSFENHKALNNPYLQFNDIIEYKGKMYFVTNEGLYVFKNKKITLLSKKENLAGFVKTKNELYLWTIFGEFYKKNGVKLDPMPFNGPLSKRLENIIINSVIFNNNSFYISTVVGGVLLRVDLEQETISNIEQNNQAPYFINKYGGEYISGTTQNASNKKLYVSVSKTPFTITLAENTGSSKTNVLFLADGTIVFSKQHEVIRLNKAKILNRFFAEKNVESIFQDSENKIWVAMNNGGICNYTDGSFKASSSIRYLGNKTVISVAEDKKGNLWFGTSGSGIFLLKKAPETKYSSPNIYSSKKNEKIQSAFILNQTPVLGDDNSNVIRIDSSIFNPSPPIVFINSIKINGTDTATLNFYDLYHSQNNIEINISGYHQGKSELQYKYILEGRETDWNYSVNTNAYYTSLAPGSYTFKVFAMSDNGLWSKVPAVITFNISSPVWFSLWFIVSVIFLLIATVLLLGFYVNKKRQAKDKVLEAEKRKALVSELQALRSQMNPHFIFNTLSSIQSFITKNESKDAVVYLSKFSKLMRATLENTKKQKISIKDETDTLELYLQLEKLRLNNRFDFSILVDDGIDPQFDQIPSMLIQPYVENAIWHGVSHLKTQGKITISFHLEEEHLLKCAIEDNGVGRKKSMELKQNKSSNPSFGMSITKERVEILNSLHNSSLSVTIIDLMSEEAPLGTRIELFIPLE